MILSWPNWYRSISKTPMNRAIALRSQQTDLDWNLVSLTRVRLGMCGILVGNHNGANLPHGTLEWSWHKGLAVRPLALGAHTVVFFVSSQKFVSGRASLGRAMGPPGSCNSYPLVGHLHHLPLPSFQECSETVPVAIPQPFHEVAMERSSQHDGFSIEHMLDHNLPAIIDAFGFQLASRTQVFQPLPCRLCSS
jgi:hypothetical protein